MKIGDVKTTPYANAVRRAAPARAAGSATVANIGDSAGVLGIPENELTPKVRAAIMSLLSEVHHLRDEVQQSQRRIAYLEQLADQDTLVPVVNRRAFVRELSRVMSYANRYGVASSVLYFDINGMKRINDTHGHAAGDAALVHVSRVLAENVRESDVVGRLGGDEFGVILAHADAATAREKAQSLSQDVARQSIEWKGTVIDIRVSFGAYTFAQGESADAVLAAADRAMYRHKNEAARA